MKTRIAFLSLLISYSVLTSAQTPCDQKALELIEHGWNRDADAQPNLPGPVNSPKQQAVVKSITDIVQALYPRPKGGEIYWHGNYDIKKIEKQYPNSYSNNIVLKNYICGSDNVVRLVAYTASVFVNVNSLGFMGGEIEMNGKLYSTVRALTQPKFGYTYFNWDENDREKTVEEWIITYKDKLPYTYLTRKEYITEARADQAKKMEAKLAVIRKDYKVRPQAEQDAEKQRFIDGFKKNYQGAAYDARIAQFNKDYKSDQQKLDVALADIDRFYGRILKTYDDFLASHNDEYLAKPAMVLPYTREYFDGFEKNAGDKNLVYVIRDDPSYYNKNLPVSSPQYITVLLRTLKKKVPDNFFYEALNRKELLDNISALLGK